MGNKEIARQFSLLATLMELHGENAFKTKAYANAYLVLRKWDQPLDTMSEHEIAGINGLGSSVAAKIHELNTTGQIEVLEKLKARTPEGIQRLLSIRGLGPKKVRQIWDELQVESPAELLYACNENRLVSLQGFGLKTQEDLRQKITYYLDSQNQVLYGNCIDELNAGLDQLKMAFPSHQMAWVGEVATRSPVINQIQLLVVPSISPDDLVKTNFIVVHEAADVASFPTVWYERLPVMIHFCLPSDWTLEWSKHTMHPALFAAISKNQKSPGAISPEQWLEEAGFKNLPEEWLDREGVDAAVPSDWSDLVGTKDLKGILHNHSTWSDGIHTLEEMAMQVRESGFAYFAICDHSRSAFYANGLSAERVLEQMDEIDRLNAKLKPFKIFKGIESDILGDGSLDYEDDVLAKFDLVVASVHSNLRMDEEKAMSRLIRAIENPYTRMLGHSTGRLLLARQGYPVDHRKLIDACRANGVAIELNANPLRLDIDYKWLLYCMEQEVWVSINPDAHSKGQVDYVKYGVYAARKGGLKTGSCLNALSLDKFQEWVDAKRT